MDRITILQAQKLTSPNPFVLIAYAEEDGRTNLTAIFWWSYVSNNPPTISVCISAKGFANERIKANNALTINVVSQSLAEKAFQCGIVSGRKCSKAEKFAIELEDNVQGFPKKVKASVASMNCRVDKIVSAGDHDFNYKGRE